MVRFYSNTVLPLQDLGGGNTVTEHSLNEGNKYISVLCWCAEESGLVEGGVLRNIEFIFPYLISVYTACIRKYVLMKLHLDIVCKIF